MDFNVITRNGIQCVIVLRVVQVFGFNLFEKLCWNKSYVFNEMKQKKKKNVMVCIFIDFVKSTNVYIITYI